MRRWSIRLRIGLASAVVAMGLLAVVALVLPLEVHAAASATVGELAHADLVPYVTDLRTQPDEGPDAVSPGTLVLIIDPSGVVRRDSMPHSLERAVRRFGATADTVRTGAVRYRVARAVVRTRSGIWHMYAVRDLQSGEAVADRVTATVLIGAPVTAAGTGAIAWLVAALTLRPVSRLRQTAERLYRDHSAETLPVGPAHDEVALLAATLNGLLGDLRASVEHERRLTADASHELRTPIAVIAAQAELVSAPPTAGEIAELRRSIARLATLADDLLELSRPQDPVAEDRRIPVKELVTEAMDAVDRARVLAPAEVLVDLELAPELDESPLCPIDRSSFERILTNLISNALAATTSGSVVVGLRTEPGAAILTVADTGAGVPAHFLPRAFDRFSRPDGQPGDRGGAGLGLAVVERLATNSGGAVSLTNGAIGAVATVRLPAVRADVESDRDRPSGAPLESVRPR